MDLILDSANRPLEGKRWFLQSDEPWQTYSACVEIRNALNCPEGVDNYVCHLPIHQVNHYINIADRDLDFA